MWTLVDDDNDIIHVRAILNTATQADEIRNLITALEKRLPKDKPDATGSAVVRPTDPAGSTGVAEKAEAEASQTAGA